MCLSAEDLAIEPPADARFIKHFLCRNSTARWEKCSEPISSTGFLPNASRTSPPDMISTPFRFSLLMKIKISQETNLIDQLIAEQQSLTAVERFAQKHERSDFHIQSRYYEDC